MDKCIICHKLVYDYIPVMCCNGQDCGCMGLPIYPCTCSEECNKALFDNIGISFEERRKKAGIKLLDT